MKLKESKKIFRAFADETRLRIMNLLSEGELCVCDLMRVLKEPQSKVSRHLAYLKHGGLAEGRREGLWMHYRLSKIGRQMFHSSFLGLCQGSHNLKELGADLKELNSKKKSLVACCR
jgi:ArsR family transcriptional regulator